MGWEAGQTGLVMVFQLAAAERDRKKPAGIPTLSASSTLGEGSAHEWTGWWWGGTCIASTEPKMHDFFCVCIFQKVFFSPPQGPNHA